MPARVPRSTVARCDSHRTRAPSRKGATHGSSSPRPHASASTALRVDAGVRSKDNSVTLPEGFPERPEQMLRSAKTILVVDDDLEIRETLRDVLEEEGYRVESAANGAEALLLLRRPDAPPVSPDLILLDLMMPEMNGWQFCEAQRGDPALSSIPVLIISAASLGAARGSVAGNPLLKKPIELERLLAAVERYAR